MWRLDPVLPGAYRDEAALAAAWRTAKPFPHLVVDGLVAEDRLPELLLRIDEEPLTAWAAEHYAFEASAPEPRSEALRELRDGFVRTLAPLLSRTTGRPLARADMRAYAYGPGHHLLPHTDHQEGLGRVVAYAYYLPSPSPPEGGELELFACTLGEGAALEGIASARRIAPVANRLVLFEVSDVSLHQVHEVLGGVRLSLAGWFYAEGT